MNASGQSNSGVENFYQAQKRPLRLFDLDETGCGGGHIRSRRSLHRRLSGQLAERLAPGGEQIDLGLPKDLNHEFASLEAEESVNKELDALKARVAAERTADAE